MKDYRISKNRDEIIQQVNKNFESENKMTIWQKGPLTDLRLFKCEVKFYSIDQINGTFSIAIEEDQRKKFNPALETYFLLEIHDFVFKTQIAIAQPKDKSIINFKIPHDVRLTERRAYPRVYVDSEEKRFVFANFISKAHDSVNIEVSCPIYNISKAGICIIVSKETLSSIQMDGEIELEGMGFFESLDNEMMAIVKNARVYSKKGFSTDEFYALGLELKPRLNQI